MFVGVRVLVSQLSEQFLPLWQPAVDSIAGIMQESVTAASAATKGVESVEISEPTKRNSHAPSNKRSRAEMRQDSVAQTSDTRNSAEGGKRLRVMTRRPLGLNSAFHRWLVAEMHREVLLTCCTDSNVPAVKDSERYQKMKRPVKKRFNFVGIGSGLKSSNKHIEARKTEERVLWGANSSVCSREIKQTNGLKRHEYYWKVLSSLINLYSANIQAIGLEDGSTVSCIKQSMKWALQWCLTAAFSLTSSNACEVYNSGSCSTAVVMSRLQNKAIESNQRLAIQRFEHSSTALLVCDSFEKFDEARELSGQLMEECGLSVLSVWNQLVEICFHRVISLPTRDLQLICLKVINIFKGFVFTLSSASSWFYQFGFCWLEIFKLFFLFSLRLL